MNVNAGVGCNSLAPPLPPVPIHPRIVTKPRIAMPAVIDAGTDVGIRDTADQYKLQAEQDK
jgi:hypothetical protein